MYFSKRDMHDGGGMEGGGGGGERRIRRWLDEGEGRVGLGVFYTV